MGFRVLYLYCCNAAAMSADVLDICGMGLSHTPVYPFTLALVEEFCKIVKNGIALLSQIDRCKHKQEVYL